jgi:hypothetical protein
MASPPYNPNEAVPGDTDVAANFPAAERAFRDVIESWLLEGHDRYGHNLAGYGTAAERAADVNFSVGSLWYNTDDARLEICSDDAPQTFIPIAPDFESGDRVVLQQTAAPLGWTKEVDSAYHDVALRLSTGTVSSGGTTVFSTIFAKTETEGHALTAAENGPHTHTGNAGASTTVMSDEPDKSVPTFTAGTASGSSGFGTPHTHPMDIRVKYRDVCIFEKD